MKKLLLILLLLISQIAFSEDDLVKIDGLHYRKNKNLFTGTIEKHWENGGLVYRKKYKHKEDYFITKWPPNSSIIPWYNKLAKQGYLTPHIHPGGWLSGVFYLSVPKLLNKNEGSIKLSLFGSKYPDDKNLIHSPRDFDIILFPSSLYHQTIPFNSQDERHSIAFDVVKKI